jgi:lipid II:glycine glycyltransferase (peptidoglycan interpeptide bridge formation enzyme)
MSSQRLYDTDFYAWTQQQAEKLREVRDNRLDAENLAEEVADLGKSELRAMTGHLDQLLIHLLKAAYSPAQVPKHGWLNEADLHHREMLKAFSPSMRQKIDLASSWRTAVRQTNRELADYGEAPLPSDIGCPFTIDALLSADVDVDAAIDRLKAVE